MAKRLKRPKAIPYKLIPPTSDAGKPMYEQLYAILDAHHHELSQSDVQIALAWALAWKPDVDGRLVLGKCKKASDLDRELAPYDFVILLNRDFWEDRQVTPLQRTALLDHELCHAAIAYDEQGEPKVDARGRTVYRIRKHDLEEFEAIVARHGCYKRDIETFMQALARARRDDAWPSYSRVQEALTSVGVTVDLSTVATWREAERREVLTWAQLRAPARAGERVNAALSPTMPACLAAAVRPAAGGDDHATH